MKQSVSKENYLKVILRLQQAEGEVRATDVAEALGVSKPSVSRAVSLLREEGYLTTNEQNKIRLTAKGSAAAQNIEERFLLSREFLLRLGVCESVASADAGRMEHAISEETLLRMRAFLGVT